MKSIVIIGYISVFAALAMACTPLPPYAEITSYDNPVIEGQTAFFTGSGYTRDGGLVSYQWDFPSQAYNIQNDKTTNASCKFDSAGYYSISFTVKSSTGLSTTEWCIVTVLDGGPWYVSVDGDDDNDGQSWTNALRTIQTAIDIADDGETIYVASGIAEPAVYYEQLDMKGKSLNIQSVDQSGALSDRERAENTIIDAQERGTAVVYRGNEDNGTGVALEGFTITGGAPTGEGLALHLELNETTGSAAADSSGKGRNGDLVNEPDWATDRNGNGALLFDGTDDHVEITEYKGVVGGGSRTCTAWIKTTDSVGEILSWGEEYSGGRWIVRINEGGQLRAEVQGGNIIGTTIINDDAWHHVAVVVENDGSPDIEEARLYVDGQLETISYSVDEPINTGSVQNVLIGVYFEANLPRYFQGLIDDVCIYSRALGLDEIETLAGQISTTDTSPVAHWKLDGNASDSSVNDFDGTVHGGPSWENGYLGQALDFDGDGDYISIDDSNDLSFTDTDDKPFSISLWVNFDDMTAAPLVSKGGDGSGREYLIYTGGADIMNFRLYDDSTGGYLNKRYETALTNYEGQWTHWVFTYNGNETSDGMAFYLNGDRVDDSNSDSGTYLGMENLGNDLLIGKDDIVGLSLSGSVDDVRIYDYDLSAAGAKGLYETRFSDGGGIKGHGASANISKCIIKDNASETDGGGMDGVNGVISHSYIMGNTAAGNGGGLSGCNGDMSNCVIAKNAALNAGAMDGCDGDILSCTIADNAAVLIGGGLQDCGGSIVNSILWNNRDNSGLSQESQIRDCTAAISFNCIQYWSGIGTGNSSGDPNFVNHNAGDYHLDAASMCINIVEPNSIYADQVDLDGNPRAEGHDLRIDLGAYEFQQKIWYVKTDGSDTNNGKSWNTAFATIQKGIDAASDNDIVIVANGTYTGEGNRDVFISGKAIVVRSQDGPQECIIDCEGAESEPHRGFCFYTGEGADPNDSILDGFTIKNGYAPITYGSSSGGGDKMLSQQSNNTELPY